jgi:hypothetical protein
MKSSLLALATLALMFGASQAKADFNYTFTYSDGSGNAGYGTLVATASGLGDGSLLVTSGSLTLTSSSVGGGTGTYSLIPTAGLVPYPPAPPAAYYSPSGLFAVDDLIYPANNAASGVNPGIGSNPSYLTLYGLLFGPPGTGSQTEINIWGIGGGDYAIYSEIGGSYNIQTGSGGSFELTAAPAPNGLALCGLSGFVFLGVLIRRRKTEIVAATSA